MVHVDAKSGMFNMGSGPLRENHMGYPNDLSRQDVLVNRIAIIGRLLQSRMKTYDLIQW